MRVRIHTLTSPLHDEAAVAAVAERFLGSLEMDYSMEGAPFETYGDPDGLDLIYVRTGGTECVFLPLLPKVLQSPQPVYLLTSGLSNSLAASMEILSYLRQRSISGEVIHGSPAHIRTRIGELCEVEQAREKLRGMRLGVIGKPSDWLISSTADYGKVREKLGVELIDVPIEELIQDMNGLMDDNSAVMNVCGKALLEASDAVRSASPGACKIYVALSRLLERRKLDGFTLRCFDLLVSLHNTSCLAFAMLNAEGYIAGCEGDVPSMLSMAISRGVSGVSGFMANPSRIDTDKGEVLFAHCTVPLDMVDGILLHTHFESGEGIGVRGHVPEGPVTVLKVSGDLSRHYCEEGVLLGNQAAENLCRTQVIVRLPDTEYFLKDPIGNHHVIIPGCHKNVIDSLLQ